MFDTLEGVKDADSPTIQAIHVVSVGSPRRRIELDSGETFSVDVSLVVRFDLRAGTVLDPVRRETLLNEDARIRAKSAAFDLLRLRSYSTHEMATHLRRKGFSEPVVADTLDALKALGYLSDEKFAREWIETRLQRRPRSKLVLEKELRRKGLDRTTIERALRTLSAEDEHRTALELARRQYARYRTLPRDVAKRRLYEFLLRRGFSYELTRDVLREVTGAHAHELG